MLVFEDLHWADDGLLDFVDHLVDWASGVPLLVVGTARPELLDRRPGWGGGKLNATTLSLSPLADDETAQLSSSVLAAPCSRPSTQAALLERAGGNPLYAEEFARHARRTRCRRRTAAGDGPGHHRRPARRARAEEKGLLQDAAVLGQGVLAGAAATLGGARRARVEETAARARAQGVRPPRAALVRRRRDASTPSAHVLVRDVAYGQIPRAGAPTSTGGRPSGSSRLGARRTTTPSCSPTTMPALELAAAAGRTTAELVEPARRALREAGDRASALNSFAAAARFYGGRSSSGRTDDPSARMLFSTGGRYRPATSTAGAIPIALAEARRCDAPRGDRRAAELEALSRSACGPGSSRERAHAPGGTLRAHLRDEGDRRANARGLGVLARASPHLAGERSGADPRVASARRMREQIGFDDGRPRCARGRSA